MFPRKIVPVENKLWGQLPSGEILEFNSCEEYEKACRDLEDEIYDEMARLEEERELWLIEHAMEGINAS